MRKLSNEKLDAVYGFIAKGMSNREIATRAGVARRTVCRMRSIPRDQLYAKKRADSKVAVKPDAGSRIPGSKMFRGYCIRCGEAIRVTRKQNALTSLGSCCSGGNGSQRNFGQADSGFGETGVFY